MAAALALSGCFAAENYYVETRNGSDIYTFQVNAPASTAYNHFLKMQAESICPHGYRVVDSKLLRQGFSRMNPGSIYQVTIACPAR
ncbi:MAG: hypothetical protein GKR98_00410 [Boseongicola sp.]|nr:MAG: hypothetical protein GKR98_00410 [Boseongicola sp.]